MKGPLYVGMDIGAVSINAVVIDEAKRVIYEHPYLRHFGKVEDVCREVLSKIYELYPVEEIASVSFTGNHGRKLASKLNLFFEFESIAQVRGVLNIIPDVRTIISMGGQDTALFQISHNENGWELEYFMTNGPCASGTGSFIDQQAQRLSISIYDPMTKISDTDIDKVLKDFIRLGLRSVKPANVACRCTVFTKSDMIHLQNKGEKLEDIIYGLHIGNARNYMSTIVGNRVLKEPIVFIGGMSLNELQLKAFKEYFERIFVPLYSTSMGAIGVAIMALERGESGRPSVDMMEKIKERDVLEFPVAERLEIRKTQFHESRQELPALFKAGKTRLYLGLDVGSTTTKYVLMDEERRIVDKRYVPTRGKPIEVTKEHLAHIESRFGNRIEIVGVATTGSGRHVVGDFLNADLMIDEITAHARGAVEIDPQVDTIFEIGGQDSKYIYIQNKNPLDFDMNKVCAAGTGSFLHELANKYGVNIVGEFQEIALGSKSPIKLAERCTVFMESDLVSFHQRGAQRDDLLAGLCYAIVHNYLNRVVGKRRIGKKIMFLGGPSLNKGVVAAFERVLDQPIIVPPNREVLGAYGAAICLQELMAYEGRIHSSFRGLRSAIEDDLEFKEVICNADPQCHNQCKLKIYDFDGRKSVWGGECGRYEIARAVKKRSENYFAKRQEILGEFLEGVVSVEGKPRPKGARAVVGIPMALHFHQTVILWAYFLKELGFCVVLTPATNNDISKKGVELTLVETCFPVKVSHGHFYELRQGVDFIFAPHMINMPTPAESEAGFFCPMVQAQPFMVKSALDLPRDKVVSPVIRLKERPEVIVLDLYHQLRPLWPINKSDVKRAFIKGAQKMEEFYQRLRSLGRQVIDGLGHDEALIVVTGRYYNLYDERLNLRLGQNLSKLGLKALPMDFLDISDFDLSDFPSMYWGLGALILRAAKYIKANHNVFGIHLTNFCCGPDSFIEHFYRHVMGNKPYLILELDEHSAVAGVMTRLEAYKNVVQNVMRGMKAELQEPKVMARE